MKTPKREQKSLQIILATFTQLIMSHLCKPNHSQKSKRNLNSPITVKLLPEFQNQLNMDKEMKESIKHQQLKELSQLTLPRKLICLIDIPCLSSDNSTMVFSMPISNSRRWKSQMLFNLPNFIQLDQFQRMTQPGIALLLHSNTTSTSMQTNEHQWIRNNFYRIKNKFKT